MCGIRWLFTNVAETNSMCLTRKGQFCTPAWHPLGSAFAIPGKDGDIEIIERDTWKKIFTLQKGHQKVFATLPDVI